MSRVFHSRVYGAMHKRARRRLGLGRYRREEVWRLMAEEEVALAATTWWRSLSWWRRLWLRLARWLTKGATSGRTALIRAYRRCIQGERANAPHSATGAVVQRR